MLKTIAPKSDQINFDDLIGGAITIKIRDVKIFDTDMQPCFIYYEGDNGKPYKPSKGSRRALVELWGADETQYIGRSLTLYGDDKVTFGKDVVGGIRISHASHISEPMRILETVGKGKRKPVTIEVLKTTKKTLTDLEGAMKAIKEGTVTFAKLDATYELTEQQILKLK